jgi:hypothetical protein
MFVLTLTYPDLTTFIVGGFNGEKECDLWVSTEQAKDTWIKGTTWDVVDNTPIRNRS